MKVTGTSGEAVSINAGYHCTSDYCSSVIMYLDVYLHPVEIEYERGLFVTFRVEEAPDVSAKLRALADKVDRLAKGESK
jgi:hypothetical protein